jgi:DNA processing protein
MPEDALPSARGRLHLSDEQRLQWLRLCRSENVGPATFRDLVNHYGSAGAALEALPELSRRGGIASRIRVCSITEAEREMEAARRHGARFIGMGEPDYPPLMRGLDHPPPLICVRGSAEAGQRPSLGVVGSRNASITGQKLTARLSREIGLAGHVIVSGLARGIDGAAHKAALETGTIAVLAGGIDIPFPTEHTGLAEEIVAHGGALVSEMPMGWQPRAIDFPRRNRIIAGLSLGVLVVEAAMRSGSLITARLAGEAGRLVLAVPGSPLDPRAEGTNHLIRQGATLVTSAADIIEALSPMGGGEPQLPFDAGEEPAGTYENGPPADVEASEDARARIVAALGPSPVEIDDIIRFTSLSPGEVQMVLLELDLAGRLERHGGNRVSLQPELAAARA